jgi:hypothetical protein
MGNVHTDNGSGATKSTFGLRPATPEEAARVLALLQARFGRPSCGSRPNSVRNLAAFLKRFPSYVFGQIGCAYQAWLLRQVFLRILCSELYSLSPRIRSQRDTKETSVYLGPAAETLANGRVVSCTRTYGRMNSLRAMLASRPWATLGDRLFFLEGWERGVEWVFHSYDIPHTCIQYRVQKSSYPPPPPLECITDWEAEHQKAHGGSPTKPPKI